MGVRACRILSAYQLRVCGYQEYGYGMVAEYQITILTQNVKIFFDIIDHARPVLCCLEKNFARVLPALLKGVRVSKHL